MLNSKETQQVSNFIQSIKDLDKAIRQIYNVKELADGTKITGDMKRELIEETSIKNIKILKEIEHLYQYNLPKNLVGIIWKGKFRGQKQKWFIVRFIGNENEINLNTKHPEFIEWKWIDYNLLPDVIVGITRLRTVTSICHPSPKIKYCIFLYKDCSAYTLSIGSFGCTSSSYTTHS